MISFKTQLLLVASATILSACGGGSGGTAAPAASVATPLATTTPAENFSWSTTAQIKGITVTRANGQPLGDVNVLISTFSTVDPTGNGTETEPIRTGTIGSGLASNATGASASADFGQLTVPATSTEVLVEVLDVSNPGNGRLLFQRVSAASLASAVLNLSI